MKNSRKKITQENINAFASTLKLYVDILFAEPTKKMQMATVKSKFRK
ncbi:MAG: hypothetical protein ACPG44_08940 [Polaribacter sp.]